MGWLASALGIIYITATPGFPARGFDPISWRGRRKNTVSSPLPRELVFGAQSHCLPSRLNGAITRLSVTEPLSSVSIFVSSFTSTFWGWHYFYLLIVYLYPPEMPLMSILRLVSSFYLHIYLHVHMYAGICGCIYLSKPEVNLGCQPYCFWRQDLSLLPGTCLFSQSSELHESPCFFFSPQPWDYKSLSPCLVFLWALRMELRTWSSLLAGPAPRSWCRHLLIQLVCNNETFLFVRYCC